MYQADSDILKFQCAMTSLKKAEIRLRQQNANTAQLEECAAGYSIMFTSINFLGSLTNKVLEQAAWKYLHPNQDFAVLPDSNGDNQAEALTAVYEQVRDCLLFKAES